MSSILAMTMAAEVIPGMALAVNAAVSEETVASLAKAYDGDEERARAELEALYQAGIIRLPRKLKPRRNNLTKR